MKRPLQLLLARCRESVPYDLVGLLGQSGFEVHETRCPEHAWRLAGERAIDVILAELSETASQNLSLLRRARRATYPQPGIVALALDLDVARAARAAGAHLSLTWTLRPDLIVESAHRLAIPPSPPQL